MNSTTICTPETVILPDLSAYTDDVSLDDYHGETDGPSVDRARIWLAEKAKPAIEGKGGRQTTRRVIRRLLEDFLIEEETAASLVLEVYNPRCVPPWQEHEIRPMCRPSQFYPSSTSSVAAADADTLHTAYSTILAGLPLNRLERRQLREKRGLSDEEIERLGYRSLVTSIDKRQAVLAKVREAVGANVMLTVPGIYDTRFGPDLRCKGEGLAVPVRDTLGRVLGIRIRIERPRRNKKGASVVGRDGKPIIEKSYLWLSGNKDSTEPKRSAICHVPLHDDEDLECSEVFITEGEIKADIATMRTGKLYISVPGVGSWKLALEKAAELKASSVVLAFDADAATNVAVAQSMVWMFDAARQRALEVRVQIWPMDAGKGIDDVLTAGHEDQIELLAGEDAVDFIEELTDKHRVRRDRDQGPRPWEAFDEEVPPSADETNWKSKLLMTKQAGPRNVAHNVEVILRDHPAFAGALIYDEFNVGVAWGRTPPWVDRYPETGNVERGTLWTDDDDTRVICTLNTLKLDVSDKMVRTVARLVARATPYHPVREYLEGLTWDRKHRLGSWLSTYLGVEPSEYATKAGTWWLVQAVRRIFKPGSMAKYILTLEGSQDIGKSSALRALCPNADWFSDSHLDVGSLAGQLGLKGIWMWELAEAEILKRADRQALKGYIGQCSDHYTPKFSNHPVTVLRQTVFAMSVNPEGGGYLSDPTGNVRFWAIECHALDGQATVDIDGIERDRDQLWAEAVHLFRQGVIPEPRTKEHKQLFGEEVEDRVQLDPWEVPISAALATKKETWVEHILEDVLDIPAKSQKRGDQLRVASILKLLGWHQEKNKKVRDGKRVRLYLSPSGPAEPLAMSGTEETSVTTLTAEGWVQAVLPDGRRVLTQPEPCPFDLDDDERDNVLDLMSRI